MMVVFRRISFGMVQVGVDGQPQAFQRLLLANPGVGSLQDRRRGLRVMLRERIIAVARRDLALRQSGVSLSL
jgi:hypothetical protein